MQERRVPDCCMILRWKGERMKPLAVVFVILLGMAATCQEDSNVKPPVTKADLQIVKRARKILDSPAKWNRKDNRECPQGEKTFSLYCALEEATKEVSGDFKHRGAAMQEARFVIDEIAPNRSKYNHRLMDYNNDPTTTWADVQKFFKLLKARIGKQVTSH